MSLMKDFETLVARTTIPGISKSQFQKIKMLYDYWDEYKEKHSLSNNFMDFLSTRINWSVYIDNSKKKTLDI